MGKISVSDKIMIEITKKEKIWKSKKFYITQSPFKRFTNGIDACRKSADITIPINDYYVTHIVSLQVRHSY